MAPTEYSKINNDQRSSSGHDTLTGIVVSGFWREAKKSSRELARTVRGQTRSRYARDKSAKHRSDARNIFRTVKIEKKTLARKIKRTNAR